MPRLPQNPGMMSWSEEHFRARVEERASVLGKSVRAILREAGLSEDYLKRPAQSGRRIDALARIAGALGWSLPQLLGIDAAASRIAVDTEILERALVLADMVIGENVPGGPERRAIISRTAARAYDLLIELVDAGFPLDTEAALEIIAATFRHAGR